MLHRKTIVSSNDTPLVRDASDGIVGEGLSRRWELDWILKEENTSAPGGTPRAKARDRKGLGRERRPEDEAGEEAGSRAAGPVSQVEEAEI